MNVDITSPTLISLCTGYGGLELGLERALGRKCFTLASSEIEAFAIENLVAKMEAKLIPANPIWSDLRTFPAKQFHGLVDILCGGYPCQDFSAAGKRAGFTGEKGKVWGYVRNIIQQCQPKFVFFENVEGHISLGLSTVISDLEEEGYATTWGVFSAAEVGAPHQRKRVFILGHCINQRLERVEDGRISFKDRSQPHDQQSLRCCGAGESVGIWPSRPGEEQYDWEPPRVMGNSQRNNVSRQTGGQWKAQAGGTSTEQLRKQTQPPLGRDTDGPPDRLDYAELYQSCGNRVDELRLLGNGVVPACAEKAWRVLSERLADPKSK